LVKIFWQQLLEGTELRPAMTRESAVHSAVKRRLI